MPLPPDANNPIKSTTMLGVVQAAKVKSGLVSAKFLTDDAEYVIVMDQRGEQLAQKMQNSGVEVTGIIQEENDQKLLTVQSFRPQLFGTVDSAISHDGRLMLTRLITPAGPVVIVLDEKGVELGLTMHGRKVSVIGTYINEKSRNKEVLVKSWEEFREQLRPGLKPQAQVNQ